MSESPLYQPQEHKMTEYQLIYKGEELTSGTLLDCWKEMVRRFGWMNLSDLDLIGIKIQPKN